MCITNNCVTHMLIPMACITQIEVKFAPMPKHIEVHERSEFDQTRSSSHVQSIVSTTPLPSNGKYDIESPKLSVLVIMIFGQPSS